MSALSAHNAQLEARSANCILTFDTSQDRCSVCVAAKEGADWRFVESSEEMRTGHAEALVPMIARTLDRSGVPFSEIDRVAVTTGPGTFTGVRIGVAVARALVLSLKVPTVSVTTHELIAGQFVHSQKPDVPDIERLVITDDARRGQIYASIFQPDLSQDMSPAVTTPQELARKIEGHQKLAILGTGAELVAAELPAGYETITATISPNATHLARMAMENVPDSKPPAPLYLRAPDAKPQAKYRLPRKAHSAAEG